MTSAAEALALARFVIIALSAIASSVVATMLHRKMELSTPSPYRHPGGPPRRRGPALPKLFFSVMLTDWFFGCAGAISLSMELVMGYTAKMRNVLGVTVEGVFQATLVATMLWGPILSVFVLTDNHATPAAATANEANGDNKRERRRRTFRVRTSWFAAWLVASVYGMLASTHIQAYVLDWPGKHAVRTTRLVYLSTVYCVSLLMVISALVVLLQRRRRLWGHNQPAPIRFSFATNTTSEPTPMLARSLADSRVKQEQVVEAKRYELHMKIVQYMLLVLFMELPYMLYHWMGYSQISIEFAEVADCLLFAMPLVNTIVFARWKDVGTGRGHQSNRDRDDDSSSTMMQSTEGPGGHTARINGNGSVGIFGMSSRPGAQGVFGQGSRVGGGFASSYRSLFGSSNNNANASGVREKDTAALKGTFIGTGQDQVTLDDLNGLTNLSFIAEGASGSVFKAQWLGIEVAMKIIKLPNTESNGVVDADLYRTIIQNSEMSFIEEASLCARLRHPNITLFIRAGFYEGKLGILTEYCARGSLKDVLKRHFPLSWRRKVALALHISKGLTYLHARNPTYIHRDLKASNILVTETWQAKLAVR
jgi:tRNA A-37 threonylcarbamoyl transferase component Bud32